MLTSKYRPKNIDNFVGNKCVIQPFIRWLLEWDSTNKKTKCALVSGKTGIGKSLLVELILTKYDYNIINLSIDNERDKEILTKNIKPLLKIKKTLFGQENCLVVSDIDSGGDYGFISTLVGFVKESQIPIICICDDRYCQNIKPILNYCYDIKLVKPSYDEIYRLVYKIVLAEKIKISKSTIDKLFEQSNGDIRFILNNLQLGSLKKSDTSKNIQSLNIFETTEQLLSIDASFDDKFNYYFMSSDIHLLMIYENYISNTFNLKDNVKRLENISNSADCLSDSDLFDSVFNFELSPYVAVNTIKATEKCNKKTIIKFPQFLGKMSTINKNKKEKLNYNLTKFKF
jgi:replication factor C subunit 1